MKESLPLLAWVALMSGAMALVVIGNKTDGWPGDLIVALSGLPLAAAYHYFIKRR